MEYKRIDVTASAAEHEATGLTVDDFVASGLVDREVLADLMVDWHISPAPDGAGWIARSRLYEVSAPPTFSAATEEGIRIAILMKHLRERSPMGPADAENVRALVASGATPGEILDAGVRAADLIWCGMISYAEVEVAGDMYKVDVRLSASGMSDEWYATPTDGEPPPHGGHHTGATKEEVWIALYLDVIRP